MKWNTAPLGKITTVCSGTTPDSSNPVFWGGSHVWVTPTDLGKLSDIWITDSERHVTDSGADSCNLVTIPRNAVVMSSRAPIGHLGIAKCSLFTNQGCKSFVCSGFLDHEFLYFVLRYRMPDVQALGSGATFTEVSKSALESFEISFPDLDEQRRIAARLKAQLAEVETARIAAEAQLGEARTFARTLRARVLVSIERAERVPLGDMLLGVEAGKSFQTSERLANDNELGVLKVSAVSWSEFRPDEAKAIDEEYLPDARHRVVKGDILISRANTVELVGAVVRADKDYPNRLLSDKTLRLVPDISKVLPDYLVHMLRMPEARSYIQGNATGTSDSMRNISQKTISAIPIPKPDSEIQQTVAMQLTEIEWGLKEIESALNVMRADIVTLPAKLLAQAFEIDS
jgi:type I restriction enzyme, S subunit